MKLKHYIQGDKRGKEANRLERQAMGDPFLHDALDGFDSIPGHHADVLERLEKKVLFRSTAKKRKLQIAWWSMAATVLLLIGLGSYLFMQNKERNAPIIATTRDITPKSEDSKDKVAEIAKQTEEKNNSVQKFTPPVIKPDEEVSQEEEMATQQEVMESTAAVGAVNFDKGTDDIVAPMQAITAEATNIYFIHGKVVDESGQPLMGANIKEKETGKETITDLEGRFTLRVMNPDSAKLQATYIGYNAEEIKAFNEGETLITLNPNNQTLREMAVVGYGSRKAARLTAIPEKGSQEKQTYFGKKEFLEFVKKNANKNVCGEQRAYVKVEFSVGLKGTPYGFNFKEFSCEDAKLEIEKLLIRSPHWTKPDQKVLLKISW